MLLNVGSGQRPFAKPWVNVDCQERWNPNVVADAAELSKHFHEETADMIVLHHVLEHFGCGEANIMLGECYKVLRKGGSLIVTVPDLRALARKWLFGGMDTRLYMINLYGAYMGDEADRHKFGFDKPSLIAELHNAAPWSRVKDFDWRDIAGASISRDFWIAGKEAIK